MPRFFLTEENFHINRHSSNPVSLNKSVIKCENHLFDENESQQIFISGEDALHISKSLRMMPGEYLTVCDSNNYEYKCVISSINEKEVILSVCSRELSSSEASIKVILYQCLTKSDKFDSIIQKAVEIGVHKIVPVLSERCISRPDNNSIEKKIIRWQKISKEAAKQSGRAVIPKVSALLNFNEAIYEMSERKGSFICYEGDCAISLKQFLAQNVLLDYCFMIGPEGGFSLKETENAKEKAIPLLTLGKRILRTETASSVVLSAMMYHSGNLE